MKGGRKGGMGRVSRIGWAKGSKVVSQDQNLNGSIVRRNFDFIIPGCILFLQEIY